MDMQYVAELISSSSVEKKYAHFIGQASWAGARIIQGQWTPQAQRLYDLLILTFSDGGKLADLEGLKQRSGVSPEDWEDIMQYTTQVISIFRNIERHICLDCFHLGPY